MKNYGTREMVLAALGIALVYITTMFIKLPNSIGGYLNLGDGFILLFAGFLHPFTAFLVGGLGSALADLTGGYGTYAIATLIIKGIEGGLLWRPEHRPADVLVLVVVQLLVPVRPGPVKDHFVPTGEQLIHLCLAYAILLLAKVAVLRRVEVLHHDPEDLSDLRPVSRVHNRHPPS